VPARRKIAVLTCARVSAAFDPDAPGLAALLAEDGLLVQAFRDAGHDAEPVVWNAPGVRWDAYDAAVVRSTWDYPDDVDGFLAGLARIDAACPLMNDLATISWNARKRYLVELAARGVEVLPTASVEGGSSGAEVPASWRRVVVKPEVGAGASGIEVGPREDLPRLLAGRTGLQLVQPFAEAVATEGEWGLVFLGGAFSHALLKRPAAGDYRVQPMYGGTTQVVTPSPADLAAAEAVLASAGRDPLYARVDMVRHEGRLHLMELELIEPVLFFGLAPDAPRRLVEATLARLER